MRSLHCPNCGTRVHFENNHCLHCGSELGFEPASFSMVVPSFPNPGDDVSESASADQGATGETAETGSVGEAVSGDEAGAEGEAADDSGAEAAQGAAADAERDASDVDADTEKEAEADAGAQEEAWTLCANAVVANCNWVVPGSEAGTLCRSCALTRTRPPDGDEEGHAWFLEAEAAKRRLVAQLLDLGLPVVGFDHAEDGLGFDLLTSRFDDVTTGHEDGLITVDLAEADDAHREMVRNQLGEAYRTVLGHFRHEVGHYYWMVLVRDGGHLDEFRAVFGDEQVDYGEAMSAHYGGDGPTGWEDDHVSAYATMHPWEDWAETFAHTLHILDALQTAAETGVTVISKEIPGGIVAPGDVEGRPFDQVVEQWIPLAAALNALNRSMGASDLYPFVLSPTVIDKLAFVDRLVREAADQPT